LDRQCLPGRAFPKHCTEFGAPDSLGLSCRQRSACFASRKHSKVLTLGRRTGFTGYSSGASRRRRVLSDRACAVPLPVAGEVRGRCLSPESALGGTVAAVLTLARSRDAATPDGCVAPPHPVIPARSPTATNATPAASRRMCIKDSACALKGWPLVKTRRTSPEASELVEDDPEVRGSGSATRPRLCEDVSTRRADGGRWNEIVIWSHRDAWSAAVLKVR
jgi:hypothetical protein